MGRDVEVLERRPHEAPLDRTHRQASELKEEANTLTHSLDRFCERYRKLQTELLDQGVRYDILMSPQLEAACAAHSQHGPDRRLSTVVVGEAPMP